MEFTKLLFICGCIVLPQYISAQPAPTRPPVPLTWSLSTLNIYPNPQSNPSRCNRNEASWICDPNNVFKNNLDEMNKLNSMLVQLREDTTGGCPCNKTCNYPGLPFIVAIMRDFDKNETELLKIYAEHLSENVSFFTCQDCVVYVVNAMTKNVHVHFCENTRLLTIQSHGEECLDYLSEMSRDHFDNNNILESLRLDIQMYMDFLQNPVCTTRNRPVEIMYIVGIAILGVFVAVIMALICVIWLKKPKRNTTESVQMLNRQIYKK